jgi:plasmid stabilization system protein ParE
VKVRWTPSARAALRDIKTYIARDSAVYSQNVVDGILRRTRRLKLFPYSGGVVPEYGRKDLREVVSGNYRIIYRVKPAVIEVVAVIHGARQLPVDPPG